MYSGMKGIYLYDTRFKISIDSVLRRILMLSLEEGWQSRCVFSSSGYERCKEKNLPA